MEVCTKLMFIFAQVELSVINANGSVTVKDVPAKDFIEAFSKHLKKGNKFKIPEVSDGLNFLSFKLLSKF